MSDSGVALGLRLERADEATLVAFTSAHREVFPEREAEVLAVGGGHAAFSGSGSPVNQAVGLGLEAPVRPAELEHMEEFFRSRGALPAVEVAELADPRLAALLAQRGYRPAEESVLLSLALRPDESERPDRAIAIRPAAASEAEEFGRILSIGFTGGAEALALFTEMAEANFATDSIRSFFAEVDGRPAAAAGMSLQGEVVFLSGTATLPEHRNRGAHSALIRHRLRLADAAGCTHAAVTTLPESVSRRNMERRGFRPAHRRMKWILESKNP